MRKIAVFDIPDDALIASDATIHYVKDDEEHILMAQLEPADNEKGDNHDDT